MQVINKKKFIGNAYKFDFLRIFDAAMGRSVLQAITQHCAGYSPRLIQTSS
ncbi:MAG: hypothetical protein ACJAYF_001680 [Arenicella sp.]|jgi:hypothetical protein